MLKKKFVLFRLSCVLSTILLFLSLSAKNGLTYERNAGRLGDCLLNYAKHLYIAHKYDLNLYSIPFAYMEDFMLDEIEHKVCEQIKRNYKKSVKIKRDAQVKQGDNILYIGSYYTIIDNISDRGLWHHYIYKKSIEDPSFGKRIRDAFSPKKMLLVSLPQDRPTVAVHIRKKSGADTSTFSRQYEKDEQKVHQRGFFSDKVHPFKFPPEQYYADQIKLLHKMLDEQPIYVHIFTDDKNPERIVHRLESEVDHPNITFDFRKEGNSCSKNMLEDICAMSQYDYLIRSGSHFPWIAQIIGNHKGIIYPKAVRWKGTFLQVTSIDILFPDKKENKLITKTMVVSD